jgi:predicted PurR-regulated permease PerM
VIVLFTLIYLVREIWIPLGLAFMLATILDPVVDRMEARGWSRMWGSAVIFGGFHRDAEPDARAPLSADHGPGEPYPDGVQEDLSGPQTGGLRRSFVDLGIPPTLSDIGARSLSGVQGGLSRSTWITETVKGVVSNLIWIVIIPIVAFWALKDFHLILGKGLLLVPHNRRQAVQTAVTEVSAIFAKYLRGLALVSALNGVATAILLWGIRVPSALLLGVIAGVLYAVPYIGALLTIVLTAGVAFVAGGWQLTLLAVVTSVILHQVIFDSSSLRGSWAVQVGLHPILSIVALLAGNALLGILGMILAVPVAACVQIGVLSLVPKLRLAIDLGTSPTTAPGEEPADRWADRSGDQGRAATRGRHGEPPPERHRGGRSHRGGRRRVQRGFGRGARTSRRRGPIRLGGPPLPRELHSHQSSGARTSRTARQPNSGPPTPLLLLPAASRGSTPRVPPGKDACSRSKEGAPPDEAPSEPPRAVPAATRGHERGRPVPRAYLGFSTPETLSHRYLA